VIGAFVVGAAGQTTETFLTEHLPDGRVTQRSAFGFKRALDVIDGMILFAQSDNEGARGVGFGLGFRAGLALAEEIKRLAAELTAQDAESAGAVAETPGDLLRGQIFDEKGAQGLVLALRGRLGLQEEPGLLC